MARYTRPKLPRNKWGILQQATVTRSSGGGNSEVSYDPSITNKVNQLWDWFYPHEKTTTSVDDNGNETTAITITDIHCRYKFVGDKEVQAWNHGQGEGDESGSTDSGISGNVNILVFENDNGDTISIGYNEVKQLLELLNWFYKDKAGNVHSRNHFIGDKDVVALGGIPMEGSGMDMSAYWTSAQTKTYIGETLQGFSGGSGTGNDCNCNTEAINTMYGWYVASGDTINTTVGNVNRWFTEDNGTITAHGNLSATGEVTAHEE